MIRTGTENLNFGTAKLAKLNDLTGKIIEYQKCEDFNKLCLCLLTISNERLYLEAKYKTIYDYCLDKFKMKKTTVYLYITVAKKFLNPDTGDSYFIRKGIDLKYSQLVRLRQLSIGEVNTMLDNGLINPETKIRDIEILVKDYLASKKSDTTV